MNRFLHACRALKRSTAPLRLFQPQFRGYASVQNPEKHVAAKRAYWSMNPTPVNRKDRSALGVFTPQAAILFILAGGGLFLYFKYEKERLKEQKQKEMEPRRFGKAAVGGPFALQTHKGETFTEKDLLGKWSLIYFGFTNCPDICPEELDKMSAVVAELDKRYGPIAQPIFVSVDPARDSQNNISRYLQDFHPRLIGLSGSYEATKAMCKVYRVYFSTPPDAKPDGDYLVDHSIYFYLMDPEGELVEAFGKINTAEDVVKKTAEEIERWEQEKGRKT